MAVVVRYGRSMTTTDVIVGIILGIMVLLMLVVVVMLWAEALVDELHSQRIEAEMRARGETPPRF